MTIDEARGHIGRAVAYRPAGNPDAEAEHGVIATVGHRWVFVRYAAPSGAAQATDPADLTLLAEVQSDG